MSSLKKRYAAKLSTNLVGMIIGVLTQSIIPRGLGPTAYGDFSFLSNFFSQVLPLFTLGTDTAFYTKLCQRQDEFELLSFYARVIAMSIAGIFTFVAISEFTGASHTLWIHQTIFFVCFAAGWGVLNMLINMLTMIGDAYCLTVSIEISRIIIRSIGLCAIVFIFFTNHLTLTSFFGYECGIRIVIVIGFLFVINRDRRLFYQHWKLSRHQMKNYLSEFYKYTHPLFVYTVIGMVLGILDRWMLQKFGGSVQQGFFGLSFQIATVCFLFTSAMTSLITREFSIAYGKNDMASVASLFRRYLPLFFSVAAFFACFASVQADIITRIFGGRQFAGAFLPVMIMALYPIHQTYGQLVGAIFFASGETKLYRNILIFFNSLGLPFSYVILAHSEWFGFRQAATGLAIKFVILQFLSVNSLLFFSTRLLKLSFIKYLGHQVVCMGCLGAAALFSEAIILQIVTLKGNVIFHFVASGLLYTGFVMTLAYLWPVIFGLSRGDIASFIDGSLPYLSSLKRFGGAA